MNTITKFTTNIIITTHQFGHVILAYQAAVSVADAAKGELAVDLSGPIRKEIRFQKIMN